MNVPNKFEIKLQNGETVSLEGHYTIKEFSSLIGFNERIVRKIFKDLNTTEAIKDRYEFLVLSSKALDNGSKVIKSDEVFKDIQTKLSPTEVVKFLELSNKLCTEMGIF
tara:strand:+ start:147 stop:473 length:327 start_codon:yes stop_codon:yes gene_type:complete